MNYRQIGLLSFGHLMTDINQGALPAMLPFFIAAHDLSFTAAAGIVFAANMASTLVQPVFGHAADRFTKPWLLSAGLLLAGLGLALTGISRHYVQILLLAVLSGIGIAAYHPEAARLVNFAAGERKGAAMSMFGVGGTLGFALGPLLVTGALLHWGLKGSLVLLVPAGLMALILLTQLSAFQSMGKRSHRPSSVSGSTDLQEEWGPFARLTLTVVGRSILFYGLNTFIPIYWIHVLQESRAAGGLALTLFAASGIIGNLVGGSLADRLGQRRIILGGFLCLSVLLPVFLWVEIETVALVLLCAIGLLLYGTYSPTIVLGQRYLPNRIGLSSGVTLGIAVAVGGGAAPIIGKIADLHGIWLAMVSLTGLPVLTAGIAWTLPEPKARKETSRPVRANVKTVKAKMEG